MVSAEGRVRSMKKKCNCLRCKHSGQCDSATGYCNGFQPTYETNADRIRSMSDEELAEFLVTVETYGYHDQSVSGTLEMFEWLQSEVEE